MFIRGFHVKRITAMIVLLAFLQTCILPAQLFAQAAGVPEAVLHFLGYTPHGPAAIAQISDFAVETVFQFRAVASELEHVQAAQLDESGRISALAAELAALSARVERTEERAARAERALECVQIAVSRAR